MNLEKVAQISIRISDPPVACSRSSSIKLVQTFLKAKRSGGEPFRAESSSYGEYSARKPFPFHVCTMDSYGNGNKRLTEK